MRSELESVSENDAIKLLKSPMIIEGIPLTKLSPVMVETVQSDDTSKVSLLRDHLLV